jgi:phosphoribosylaminoimidazole synthetase
MSKINTNSGHTYAAAGVNIDAGNELVERIKPFAKATSRLGTDSALGGFGALFDLKKINYKDPILVSTTDGVGTKLKIAQDLNIHHSIGQDLVAMCVNDLVVQGAEPLFFLDYFACGKLDVAVAEKVIKSIAEGCKLAGCALVGGETAEMPGMYKPDEYDLAGFSVGVVERDAILPSKDINKGDVVIGIASSGLHSNGFSLARKIVEDKGFKYEEKLYGFDKTLGETLLTPTKIYVKACLELIKQVEVLGFSHITGGGITENLPRVLPKGLTAEINLASWEMPLIFQWLKQKGEVAMEEMLRVLNCGVGMIAVVNEAEGEKAIEVLKKQGEQAYIIGKIIKGDHVSYIDE